MKLINAIAAARKLKGGIRRSSWPKHILLRITEPIGSIEYNGGGTLVFKAEDIDATDWVVCKSKIAKEELADCDCINNGGYAYIYIGGKFYRIENQPTALEQNHLNNAFKV